MAIELTFAQLVNVGEPLRTILFWAMAILVVVLAFLVVRRVVQFVLRKLSGASSQSAVNNDSGNDEGRTSSR